MTPNVEFKDNHGTSISNLENVKIITLSDEKGCAVVRIKKYLAELSGVQNKWPRGEQLTLTRKGRRTRACM
ncbi:hypothetical protein [Wolbachia endosymbiont (group A) of Ischnus inquisitorius]|uniref:hypothetical protein n=1 Tax=Wolbachia endosymbiont (group A) of Ischnus inquisitorius TaxID=3077922 RepID=UPI003132B699